MRRTAWERYTHGQGPDRERGDFADFEGGSIQVEIWNAIGEGDISVATDTPANAELPSTIHVPFNGLEAGGTPVVGGTLFLRDGAVAGEAPGALSTEAGAAVSEDSTAAPDVGLPGWEGPGDLWYEADGVAGSDHQRCPLRYLWPQRYELGLDRRRPDF